MINNVLCEKLYDFENNLLIDELYYQFFDKTIPTAAWFVGLKKVYDAYHNTNGFTFDKIEEYMDDDQVNMLAIINSIIEQKHKEAELIAIFTNYFKNDDGSNNLIKQICLLYQFGENSYLVLRAPLYAFTKFALNDYLDNIYNKLGGE